jgi:hypothetical protein
MTSNIVKSANEKMDQALRLLGEAQAAMQLANRFGAEPEPGTVLVFDKIFPNEGAALDSLGLNFDPEKLVPGNKSALFDVLSGARLGGRAQYGGVVVIDDDDAFAKAMQKSYRHVAIRIGNVWYTTSPRISKVSWDKLAEFIGDSQCWKVTGTEEIPLEAPQVIEQASEPADAPNAADAIKDNRKALMGALARARANGKSPTPKEILEIVTKTLDSDK